MVSYKSLSGKPSGVTAYEIGVDFIEVKFHTYKRYRYTVKVNNLEVIEHMKSLALASEGLSTYIAQNKDILRYV
jgi:hypothetical protein